MKIIAITVAMLGASIATASAQDPISEAEFFANEVVSDAFREAEAMFDEAASASEEASQYEIGTPEFEAAALLDKAKRERASAESFDFVYKRVAWEAIKIENEVERIKAEAGGHTIESLLLEARAEHIRDEAEKIIRTAQILRYSADGNEAQAKRIIIKAKK